MGIICSLAMEFRPEYCYANDNIPKISFPNPNFGTDLGFLSISSSPWQTEQSRPRLRPLG